MHSKSLTKTILLFAPLVLTGLGIIMIYSASSIFASCKFHDAGYFMKKQFVFAIAGTLGMLLVMRVPYERLRRLADKHLRALRAGEGARGNHGYSVPAGHTNSAEETAPPQ